MKIVEERKEDSQYFQGPFWIIADSLENIQSGNFTIIGERYLSNYDGSYTGELTSKSVKTHRKAWDNSGYSKTYNQDWDYYPRGRVAIYKGTAWIHINSFCNLPKVIDRIVDYYSINKLNIKIELNDETQGSHYNFKLR